MNKKYQFTIGGAGLELLRASIAVLIEEITIRKKRAEEFKGQLAIREMRAIKKLRKAIEKLRKLYNELQRELIY